MSEKDTISLVNNILKEYIEKNHLRKTPERFAILEEIYSNKLGHFSIDSLYVFMKEKNFRVTKTTLYNAMEIFLDAGLVVKHKFGENKFIFEKIYKRYQHDHLICVKCGNIIEFCDPSIYEIENKIKKEYDFSIDYHSLYYYGICSKCKKRKEVK
ncbi:MAG: transcriptional repressor [Bacteroidales bacterium]|jgi:Fur family ferric uptake transcriptional regulator|nr:transcriptional repressor [Bacteroidales bacterium]